MKMPRRQVRSTLSVPWWPREPTHHRRRSQLTGVRFALLARSFETSVLKRCALAWRYGNKRGGPRLRLYNRISCLVFPGCVVSVVARNAGQPDAERAIRQPLARSCRRYAELRNSAMLPRSRPWPDNIVYDRVHCDNVLRHERHERGPVKGTPA